MLAQLEGREDICDAVQQGANGLVVDGKSVAEIAAAMRSLREDGALRERLRQRGAEIAAAADWRSKAQAFLDLCTAPSAA